MGAFAAHGLSSRLDPRLLSAFNTGVEYQLYHALALLFVAILITQHPEQPALKWAGNLFVLGIVLFSGSLYSLALTQIKFFGPITPLGGVVLISGWFCLAFSAFRMD